METVNSFIAFGYYLGCSILIVLLCKTTIDIIRKRRQKWIMDLKALVNIGVGLIYSWFLFLSFALIVRPPIKFADSYNESISDLNDWIIVNVFNKGIIGFGIVLFIGLITYLIQRKFEDNKSTKYIIGLVFANILIIAYASAVSYYHTLYGLSVEIGYEFK